MSENRILEVQGSILTRGEADVDPGCGLWRTMDIFRARQANSLLRKPGVTMVEVVPWLSELRFPVIVDKDGVLVNNAHPHQVSPHAKRFLERLLAFATPIILTLDDNPWHVIQKQLAKDDLWLPGMILVADQNWAPLTIEDDDRCCHQPRYRESFRVPKSKYSWRNGKSEWFERALAVSRTIAPRKQCIPYLGDRGYQVPILDDSSYATFDNPGMLGITVKRFPEEPEDASQESRSDLNDAIGALEQYYAKLSRVGLV